MTRRFIIVATVIAVLLGGLAYFQLVFKPQMIAGFMAKMSPPPAVVAAEPARTERWIDRLPSIGTLTASQGVEVTTQVAGVVSDFMFDTGREVAQGTPLVQLDVSVESADLASAKATLQEAQLAFQRQSELIGKAVTSQANLDAARAKRDTAAAAVSRIEALIAQKTIKAPFAGRLGIRRVEKGQYVSPGVVLTTLQALDPIRVDFPMPEQNVAKLKIGQTIEVTADVFPGRVFRGEIQSLDARVATETRTLLVRGYLSNPTRELLPGMFANVAVLAGEPREFVTVPRTAVAYSLYGDSIYVVRPAQAQAQEPGKAAESNPGTAHAAPAQSDPKGEEQKLVAERRFVKTGPVQDSRVAILEGVASGEQVVTTGQLKLTPGAPVKIDNSQPLVSPAERPKL